MRRRTRRLVDLMSPCREGRVSPLCKHYRRLMNVLRVYFEAQSSHVLEPRDTYKIVVAALGRLIFAGSN